MDSTIRAVLDEYHKRAKAEFERMNQMPFEELDKRWDEFLLPIGPHSGQLVNILIKEAECKTILEVGTSYGYSTIWLAEAARKTGAKVISLDLIPEKQQYARDSLTRTGLLDFVEFRLGDARDSISAMKENVDFVLLDVWKVFYIECFDRFYPKLNPGAFIAADNMIQPEFSLPDTLKYQAHVRSKPDIQSMLLPVGSGIELSRYTRGAKYQ